jgi:hypothetical protein
VNDATVNEAIELRPRAICAATTADGGTSQEIASCTDERFRLDLRE